MRLLIDTKSISKKLKGLQGHLYSFYLFGELTDLFDLFGARMHKFIIMSMRRTKKASWFYWKGKGRSRKKHHPSLPGGFPAVDKGELLKSLRWTVDFSKSNFKFQFGTDVDHGAFLELGTRNMEKRPWLRPTKEKFEDKLVKDIRKKIENDFKKVMGKA